MKKKLIGMLIMLCLVAVPFITVAINKSPETPTPRGVPPQICQEVPN